MILVIKLGGKVLEEEKARLHLCEQVGVLARQGHRIVVVHGGGKQVTDLSMRLGIPVIQYQGRRVTDEATLQVVNMVLSAINGELTAALISRRVAAIGMASFEGNLLRCCKRPPVTLCIEGKDRTVDFGLVADVEETNPRFLFQLWELGLVPVISCLCVDAQGQILNLNADTVACELAVTLEAARLISVSDVDGVYLDPLDPSTRVPELEAEQARAHLERGWLKEGMVAKVETALEALERGVTSVRVVSGLTENGLLEGLEGRGGTRLVSSKVSCTTSMVSSKTQGMRG